jgi:hypothetical protein
MSVYCSYIYTHLPISRLLLLTLSTHYYVLVISCFYVNTNSGNVFIIFAAEGDLDYSGGEILAELQAYRKNEPVLDGVVTMI